MNLINKRFCIIIFILSYLTPITSNAGIWRNGEDSNQWWYDNENGTYASNGWYWIDGNNDQIEECYYFDEKGWLLMNTVTPDGYQVNNYGQWMINGEVKSKAKLVSNPVSDNRKEKNKIKSIAISQIGRPYSPVYPREAYSSKWKLKTIKDLSEISTWIPTFIYNEKGYLVEKYDYSSGEAFYISGEAFIWEKKYNRMFYSYDNSGRLIRRWQLKPEFVGVPTYDDSHWSYEYDSEGKLTKEINYAKDIVTGTQYTHAVDNYYYDTYGRLVKIIKNITKSTPGSGMSTLYAFEGEKVITEINYNDLEQTIKTYSTHDGKGITPAGTTLSWIYKADENGNIIEDSYPNGTAKSFYDYDTDGRLVKSFLKDNSGKITLVKQYIYE